MGDHFMLVGFALGIIAAITIWAHVVLEVVAAVRGGK